MARSDTLAEEARRAELKATHEWIAEFVGDHPYAHGLADDCFALVGQVVELRKELKTANFFRDKLAERLSLVETAVVELEGALACDESVDESHWRDHARHAMESALTLCKRATKTWQDVAVLSAAGTEAEQHDENCWIACPHEHPVEGETSAVATAPGESQER